MKNDGPKPGAHRSAKPWTYLTSHTHVLVCLARNPNALIREIAENVGITERAVTRILRDLVEDGALVREREGRRNTYRVRTCCPLRHPLKQQRTVGDLLKLLVDEDAIMECAASE